MVDGLGVNRLDHRDVIGNPLHVRDQFAHQYSGISTPLKSELTGGHRETLLAAGHGGDALSVANRVRQFLIKILSQPWLVVEEIQLGRGSIHVEVNEVLSLGRKVR